MALLSRIDSRIDAKLSSYLYSSHNICKLAQADWTEHIEAQLYG